MPPCMLQNAGRRIDTASTQAQLDRMKAWSSARSCLDSTGGGSSWLAFNAQTGTTAWLHCSAKAIPDAFEVKHSPSHTDAGQRPHASGSQHQRNLERAELHVGSAKGAPWRRAAQWSSTIPFHLGAQQSSRIGIAVSTPPISKTSRSTVLSSH